MKTVAIGAGIIDMSIAPEAAGRGADVTFIDKNAPGSRISTITHVG
jgi:glycine/D-amino acid oxidase-like deaminating enzyme